MIGAIDRTFIAALLAIAAIVLPVRQVSAEKKAGHDRLKDAVILLQQAEHSKNPILTLTEAKKEVEGTLVPHKENEHERAIKAINHAIDVALDGGKRKEAIAHALDAVHVLMGQSKKK